MIPRHPGFTCVKWRVEENVEVVIGECHAVMFTTT